MRFYCLIGILLISLSGCQMTQYQTARTLEKGQKQIILGLDSWNNQAWSGDWTSRSVQQSLIFRSIPFMPSFAYGWGTKGPFDHHLGYSIAGGFSYSLKWRVAGSNDSRVSAAIAPVIGLNPWSIGLAAGTDRDAYVKLPLLLTWTFDNQQSLTYSPAFTAARVGYSYQFLGRQETQTNFWNHSLTWKTGKNSQWIVGTSALLTENAPVVMQFSVGRVLRWNRGQ